MKRHKLLRTVTSIGLLAGATWVILHQAAPGTLEGLASRSGAALVGIQQWIRGVIAHATTAQLVEAAGLAWLVFVLALVLLARSKPAESPAQDSPFEISNAAAAVDVTPPAPYRQRTPESPVYSRMPPLAANPAARDTAVDYVDHEESTGDASYPPRRSAIREVTAPPEPDLVTERTIELGKQDVHPREVRAGRTASPRRGHVLALTGVSLTDERLQPYGLFVVAEDAGISRGDAAASRRTVEVIAEEVAPLLANDQGLGSSQLAALLKMAVMCASIDLRQRYIRTATDVAAAVTGAMVIGDAVHVVNVGDCRTYVLRPSVGLLQVTTDHSVISCLVKTGLLQPDALYTHPRRDQVYRSVGGSQAVTEVDTFELRVHPDDLLLLCTPGLWNALPQPQIEAILRAETDPRSAAETLARERLICAGDGDFSAVVVRPLGDWMPEFGIPAA